MLFVWQFVKNLLFCFICCLQAKLLLRFLIFLSTSKSVTSKKLNSFFFVKVRSLSFILLKRFFAKSVTFIPKSRAPSLSLRIVHKKTHCWRSLKIRKAVFLFEFLLGIYLFPKVVSIKTNEWTSYGIKYLICFKIWDQI